MSALGELSEAQALAMVSHSSVSIVVTNAQMPDNPIVYVNDAFVEATGYSRRAAIGRNCRFLQGEDTDPCHVSRLRQAIEDGSDVTVDILNYRADGESFRNRVMISPVHDDDGRLTYFLGLQKVLPQAEASDAATSAEDAMREIQHRVKNHLAMIVGLIRVQSHDSVAPEEYAKLARRIQSLQLLYEEMTTTTSANKSNELLDVGAYLTRVANAIAHLDGRAGVRVNIEAESIHVPFEQATRIGLLISEVMTNAMQHAFDGREAGLVELRVSRMSEGGMRAIVSDDGIGIPDEKPWPDSDSLGGRIVTGLLDGLGGSLDVTRGAHGTIVTLDVPAPDDDTS